MTAFVKRFFSPREKKLESRYEKMRVLESPIPTEKKFMWGLIFGLRSKEDVLLQRKGEQSSKSPPGAQSAAECSKEPPGPLGKETSLR